MKTSTFIQTASTLSAISAVSALLATSQAFALDNIIRPYNSIRADGMGGVTMTTGLYDQNFFGNPARVTANPEWRVTLAEPTFEVNNHAPSNIGSLLGGNNIVQKLGNTAGENNHVRVQTVMPAYYLPPSDSRKWAIAVGLITNTEANVDIRNNYELDPQAYTDIGPAVTFGRRFLSDDSLSVGATGHFLYRLATQSPYSFVNLIQNSGSLSGSSIGQDGTTVDFDLGATYAFKNFHPMDWEFSTGLAFNDLLGGKFNMGPHIINRSTSVAPPPQPRTVGGGVAARRAQAGPFSDLVIAAEMTDIGNNANGGMFRLLHLGTEARWGLLFPRLGINQGYWTAGLGINLKVLRIDVATYGEEMGLNPGDLEDRRYGLTFAFQI